MKLKIFAILSLFILPLCIACEDDSELSSLDSDLSSSSETTSSFESSSSSESSLSSESSSSESQHIHFAGDPVIENRIEPTCTLTGSYDLVTYCAEDDYEMSREHFVLNALEHNYLYSDCIIYPTREHGGKIKEVCSRCHDERIVDIDKDTGLEINLYDGTTLLKKYYLNENGAYVLDVPQLSNDEYFHGFYDKENNPFPARGNVSEATSIYIKKGNAPYQASDLNELESGISSRVSVIDITDDIVIDKTLYINGDVTLTSGKDVNLLRSSSFGGDLFIIGEESDKHASIYDNVSSKLSIKPGVGQTITIEGNKNEIFADIDNPTCEVNGSAFFVTPSSQLDLYNGVSIKDHKKVSNEKAFDYAGGDEDESTLLSSPAYVGGSAICNVGGLVNIYGGEFTGNEVNDVNSFASDEAVSYNGGVIYASGTTNIYDALFDNNAGSSGSAIYTVRTLTIKKATFSNNHAYQYGSVYGGNSQYCEIRILSDNIGDVIFENNVADSSGGGIFIALQASLYMNKVSFTGNTASSNGGAISSKGIAIVDNSTFTGNQCGVKGGAIYEYYGSVDDSSVNRSVQINNSTFTNNTGALGAAVALGSSVDGSSYQHFAKGIIRNSSFSNNNAIKVYDEEQSKYVYGHGGAFYSQKKSHFDIEDCMIAGNSAEGYGGAMYLASDSSATINSTTFDGNEANSNGGAIYATDNAVLSLNNSTLENNHSGNFGGGMYLTGASVTRLREIVSDTNTATTTGGFVYITTTGTELYIYSGSTENCSAATTKSENIYSNTTKCTIYIPGKEDTTVFSFDGTLIYGKSGNYTLEDLVDD